MFEGISDDSGNYSVFVNLALGFIIIGVWIFVMCCGMLVNPGVAVHALEVQGYSDIQITGRQWFLVEFSGCDTSDAAKFSATATNPAGKRVELFVCSGYLFKGQTVRTKQ